MAGITAAVTVNERNNLTRVGIALAPKPIIVITRAEMRANGNKKSAKNWLMTDSVNSISRCLCI
jgi:hypothetical protein